MRLQIPKCLITYAIVLLYLCTPILDGMVCADCAGNAPLGGGVTISHMKTSHIDVSYYKKGQTRSSTDPEQGHKSFCSICSNSLMGVEVYVPQAPILLVKSVGTHIASPFSELHYSIHKPPPNSLV